jgi:hypothetical protein
LRTTTVRREIYLLIPVAALLVLHFGVLVEPYSVDNPPQYHYEWGELHQKIRDLIYEFERFDGRLSKPMMIALAGCMLWPIRRSLHWRALKRPAVLEQLALAAAFLGVYIVLPRDYADAAYVDIRALPMLALFLIFACLHLPDEGASGAFSTLPALALGTLLAVVNLAYLAIHLSSANASITRYRAVVASVPPGSYVLPVYTQNLYTMMPLLHVGAYVVLDRDGVIPSLFSRDRGDPMKYFRYRRRPYMLDELWYIDLTDWNKAVEETYEVQGRMYRWRFVFSKQLRQWKMMDLVPVDWNRIACGYDFILLTMPFDVGLIRVPTRTVAANETAALLAVDKQGCHPGVQQKRRVQLPLER